MKKTLALFLPILIIFAQLVALPSSASAAYPQAIAKLEQALADSGYTEDGLSASIVILEDGKVIYEKSFGQQNRGKDTPVTAATLFNIGSISKVYVTAAILKLAQSGQLSLSDPVTKYIPEFKMADPRYQEITVKMLLNHSSGLPGTAYNNAFLLKDDTNKEYFGELLKGLEKESLKAKPGDYIIYCNEGFILAQNIVERVSKQTYRSFLQEEFFRPLGLEQTFLSSAPIPHSAQLAVAYDPQGNALPRECITEALTGTGGLTATAEDVARFAAGVLDPAKGILTAKSIAVFMEDQSATTKLPKLFSSNGLGWDSIDQRFPATPVLAKNGGTSQFSTQLITAPQEKLTIVGLSTSPSHLVPIINQAIYDLLEERGSLAHLSAATDIAGIKADELSGHYVMALTAAILNVDASEEKVTIMMMAGGEWFPIGELPYLSAGVYQSPERPSVPTQSFYGREIDGKTYLMQHVQTSTYAYDIVFGEKILPSDKPTVWQEMDGSKWFQINAKANRVNLGDMIVELNAVPIGYLSFAFNAPLRVLDDHRAVAASGLARDTGLLELKDNKITFRGCEYIPEASLPIFDEQAGLQIKLAGTEKAQWYQLAKPLKLDTVQIPETCRFICYSEDGEVVYDNYTDAELTTFPAGSYLYCCGNQGDIIQLRTK